jgi:hypothetical protein
MITIPKRFSSYPDMRLIKLGYHSKNPIEKKWTTEKNYPPDSEEILNHIKKGYNYGVATGFGNIIVLDWDDMKIRRSFLKVLPTDTFQTMTGSKKSHHYHSTDIPDNFSITIGDHHILDVRGKGGQVVGPSSIHPDTKKPYKIALDLPFAFIKMEDLKKIIKEQGYEIKETSYLDRKNKRYLATIKASEIDHEKIIQILVPYWKIADHRRNDLMLAITGWLAMNGVSKEDGEYIMNEIVQRTGIGYDHLSGVKYAFIKVQGAEENKAIRLKGFNSLLEIFKDIETNKGGKEP